MKNDDLKQKIAFEIRKKLSEKRRGKYAIHEGKSIEEIDSILKTKYKYGLINFTESLSAIFDYSIFLPHIAGPVPAYANPTNLINSLEKVKKRIKKAFEPYYKLMPFPMLEGEYNVIDRYKLKPIFKIIDAEIQFYKRLKEFDKRISKGGPKTEALTKLTYVWNHYIRDRRGVHWDQIEGLLHWFEKNLKYELYKYVLEYHIPDWESIKRSVLRLRKTKWRGPLDFTFVEFFKNYTNIMEKKEQSELIEGFFKNSSKMRRLSLELARKHGISRKIFIQEAKKSMKDEGP